MADKLIIKDIQQVEGALAEMSAISRKRNAIKDAMNEEIDGAKARAQQELVPLILRYDELEKAVKVFGTLNKSRLFADRKTLDLAFGVVTFRRYPRIVLQNGVSDVMELQKLREFGLLDGIRVKEELDKVAMYDWPDSKLEMVGLKRRTVDTISVDVKVEELAG